MSKNKNQITLDPFQKWAHSYGRLGTFIALVYMIALPFIICVRYNCMPKVTDVFNISTVSILLIYIPVGLSEAVSYIPVLGSSSYLTFITGNIMNLKFPAAINAMKIADVEQNTPEGDVISTIGVAVSSILTVIILAIAAGLSGVIRPVFEIEAVKTASNYIIPALFGSMSLGLLGSSSGGDKIVKNGVMGVVPVLVLVTIISVAARVVGAGGALLGMIGILIIVMIPIAILSSRIMWKKGIITVVDNPARQQK